MESIDFDVLRGEIVNILAKEQLLVLATAADGRVTARTICHASDGLDIYFGTSNKSEKYAQMKANPNVALAIGNIQIEAVAEDCGNPEANPAFVKLFNAKFPHLAGLYPPKEDDVVVKCTPTKLSLYKYVGHPAWEILYPDLQQAYRQ